MVEEALRLYPPIPLLAREAQATAQLPGLTVQKGALAIVSPWLVHRHRDHWEAPDEFRPERFLPSAPPPPRHAYLPFSLGPRVCTGAHLACTRRRWRWPPWPGGSGCAPFPAAAPSPWRG